jgi:acetoin utilization protein AcuB
MSKHTVADFMTRDPLTISPTQPLATAHRIMRDNALRHLPVLEHGKVVGIVTQGDLHLVETLHDIDPGAVLVEEAMTAEPYIVSPGTSLSTVARRMAEHRYGCAIIAERDRLVGIFTCVDALRALAELSRNGAVARTEHPAH